MKESYSVLVLLAHPDDETWVSGTLAKLADRGLEVIPVYATSGGKGSDRLDLGLSGTKLAKMRELEAIKACQVLGVSPPIFLRFADGKLTHLQSQLSNKFKVIVERVNPAWVISFMQGGITGNRDHRIVSKLITRDHSTRAVYFGLSDTRARSLSHAAQKFDFNYSVTAPVDDNEVTHRVDVSQYTHLRIQAMSQHISQFPPVMINAFTDFVSASSFEELVVSDDVENPKALEKYLD
ncbi:PIG-L family deacetylase [Shewanella eurypsychrophilus]|uniref:PIG-L family deacetylase n=1 Tax=Shewanella eurypsychrophilus TaxID=2593656 RepID=A0ABX6V1L3_9GAMM|nr:MULTISPECIES: PIG-L family deacetylase [Shewanella]QPG56514.2 PIG-L family deacetylase [Shewanella eurypsychrophilus]